MTDTRTAITVPELGSARIAFSLWYVRKGDRVQEGDRLAEVLIPGATYDVHAPAAGVLVEQVTFPGDPLAHGDVLGWIEAES